MKGEAMRAKTKATNQRTAHTRWMVRRDMAEVLDIENTSFDYPWSEKTFVKTLRQRNVIGLVAEAKDRVIGFVIYELNRKHLRILNLAVSRVFRRMRIATQLVDELKAKDRDILAGVVETNLGGQLFFKSCGFEAVAVVENFYDDVDEDCYEFEWTRAATPERRAT